LRFDEPHHHLNMLGTLEAARGHGCATALVDGIERLVLADASSRGISLTTEDSANVPLYRHLGFDVVGHLPVTPSLETWGFFRATRRDP
jgi:GNAT superfamily N-acetyltransferase